MIKFRCVNCNKRVGAGDELAGKTLECPGCGQATTVPHAEYELRTEDLEPLERPTPRTLRAAESPTPTGAAGLGATAGGVSTASLDDRVRGIETDSTGPGKRGAAASRSAVGLIVAGLVAGVFTVIWVVLALATEREFGILAWGMGALVGLVAGVIAKNPAVWFCAAAAGLAALSIVAAKGIMAGAILLAAYGMDWAADPFGMAGMGEEWAMMQDPALAARNNAVMDQMLVDGAFDGDVRTVAQSQVAMAFNDDDSDVYTDAVDALGEEFTPAYQELTEAVTARREAMSEAEIDAALAAARERHPAWIEDHTLYVAGVDRLLNASKLPDDLAAHAKATVTPQLVGGDAYEEHQAYYDGITPRQQRERTRELAVVTMAEVRPLADAARAELIDDTMRRHPAWTPDHELYLAVLDRMVQDGTLPADLTGPAAAEIASNMENDYDAYGDTADWEAIAEQQQKLAATVTPRIIEMDADERAAAVAAAKERHPDWGNADLLGLGGELDEFRDQLDQELGGSRTFLAALKSTLQPIDALWFVLAVASAFGAAKKRGEAA